MLDELRRGPQALPRSKEDYLKQYIEVHVHCIHDLRAVKGCFGGAPAVQAANESSGPV